jgi:predicted regulator of Ras-like GTPase activity (Roadblock/LC7/MglB family)
MAYDLREVKIESRKMGTLLSIDSALRKLVAQVEGAIGAIVLEADGEAVQWYTIEDSDRLRLRSAYVAVVVKACQTSASRAALGGLKGMILNYERCCLVVREIESDCFVLLELGPSANIGQALFRLDPIVRELRREIAA